ncbi:MAG: DUF998 domain-containing protein [Dehalococcoidia bacterium]|nr:DUF998 domain-containing protein [Dehalococcoidia bacterium]
MATAEMGSEAAISNKAGCAVLMDAPSAGKELHELKTRWLLVCGLLAPLLLGAFLVAAWRLTPDFSFLTEPISQLGALGRPHPWVMNAGFIIAGILTYVFAYGLYLRLGRNIIARIVWLLLMIDGIGIVLSGIFHADSSPIGAISTLEGTLHCVFAQVAFFALLTGIVVFAKAVHRSPAWRGFTLISLVVFVLNLALVVAFLTGEAGIMDGVLQLSFFGISLAWLTAVSLRALRLTGHQQQPVYVVA